MNKPNNYLLQEAMSRINEWHSLHGIPCPGVALVYEKPQSQSSAMSAYKHSADPMDMEFMYYDGTIKLHGVPLKFVRQEPRY